MIGQMVAAYRIVRKLGAGGWGRCMKDCISSLAPCCDRVLENNPWTDEESLGRFYNEARATNMVQHPGVVSIFEFGRWRAGTPTSSWSLSKERASRSASKTARAALDFVLILCGKLQRPLTVVHQREFITAILSQDKITPRREMAVRFLIPSK